MRFNWKFLSCLPTRDSRLVERNCDVCIHGPSLQIDSTRSKCLKFSAGIGWKCLFFVNVQFRVWSWTRQDFRSVIPSDRVLYSWGMQKKRKVLLNFLYSEILFKIIALLPDLLSFCSLYFNLRIHYFPVYVSMVLDKKGIKIGHMLSCSPAG